MSYEKYKNFGGSVEEMVDEQTLELIDGVCEMIENDFPIGSKETAEEYRDRLLAEVKKSLEKKPEIRPSDIEKRTTNVMERLAERKWNKPTVSKQNSDSLPLIPTSPTQYVDRMIEAEPIQADAAWGIKPKKRRAS